MVLLCETEPSADTDNDYDKHQKRSDAVAAGIVRWTHLGVSSNTNLWIINLRGRSQSRWKKDHSCRRRWLTCFVRSAQTRTLLLLCKAYFRAHQRLKNLDAIYPAKFRLGCALRMRHHPKHVTPLVADARNVFQRSVRIRFSCDLPLRIAIAEDNTVVAFQFRECRVIAKIIAFHVPDRNSKHLALSA